MTPKRTQACRLSSYPMKYSACTAGSIGAKAEFGLLVSLAGKPTKIDGKDTKAISKEHMQEFYNGKLFYDLAGEKAPE